MDIDSNTRVDLIVSGLGNIGRRFLSILDRKRPYLCQKYGLDLNVVGVVDSRGAAIDTHGLDLARLVNIKEKGGSAADYPGGYSDTSPLQVVQRVRADVLCEATPVNMEHGEPGLSCMRHALSHGMHVVTANKGPLVLAYGELQRLARESRLRIKFCGTVAGGLPAINLGQRDLAGARIEKLEALPNLTTSFILDRMAQGMTDAQALSAAQAQGCAEADPSLDVDGWDAAFKLVILANSVLGIPAALQDVSVTGITGVTQADLDRAQAEGRMIKLVASASLQGERYQLTVAPTPLPAGHPLAQLSGQHMGIVYHTDIYGAIAASILETEPVPSAASMLRDLLSIYADLP
jgi:homoserine dehydrogenase